MGCDDLRHLLLAILANLYSAEAIARTGFVFMHKHIPHSAKFKCPLCSTPLSKDRWLSVTGIWRDQERLLKEGKKREAAAEQRGVVKERRRSAYLQSLLGKRENLIQTQNEQIKELRRQLKQGTTPQMEGLLFEPELCAQLHKKFPKDKIEHHGKGGDILQLVFVNNKCVGRIVFECKKCSRMPSKYVEQARRALSQRKADYAVLVTNASKSNSFGFWTDKDVLIVHPAGVIALVSWLRDALIKVAESKMNRRQREQAIAAILEFVSSSEFRNPVREIIRRSEQLGAELKAEIKSHRNQWISRLGHYRAIWMEGQGLRRDVDSIIQKHSLGAPRVKLSRDAVKATLAYPIAKDALLLLPAKAKAVGAGE